MICSKARKQSKSAKKHGMDLTDSRIKIVHGWSARKLAALPGTGMKAEQVKALEEELNAANL